MTELEYDFIYTKYWLEDPGWSLKDIGKYYNCRGNRIAVFMEKNNIPRRSYSEAGYNAFKCSFKLENLHEGQNTRTYPTYIHDHPKSELIENYLNKLKNPILSNKERKEIAIKLGCSFSLITKIYYGYKK